MDILLVEDNPADMRLIREALSEDGMAAALHWSASGESALDYLRARGEHARRKLPDLVLLDLNLPGLNGHEVLAEIKADAELRRIPVVVLTSSSARGDVQAAYDSHANAYMVKPDGYDDILNLVGSLRRYWRDAVLLPSWAA